MLYLKFYKHDFNGPFNSSPPIPPPPSPESLGVFGTKIVPTPGEFGEEIVPTPLDFGDKIHKNIKTFV